MRACSVFPERRVEEGQGECFSPCTELVNMELCFAAGPGQSHEVVGSGDGRCGHRPSACEQGLCNAHLGVQSQKGTVGGGEHSHHANA